MKLEALIAREKSRSSKSLTLPKPTLHEGQLRVLEGAGRWNTVVCGRRYGKTVLGKYLAIEALEQGYPVGWGAPEYKYLTEVYDEIRKELDPWIVRSNAQERIIELSNGGKIEFWTMTDKNVGRSRKYKRWIGDEAAMTPELGAIWRAAIRPTLTDLKGDGWLLSTPAGPSGFFYECAVIDESWTYFKAPTWENPTIPDIEEEVEDARQSMPKSVFDQEYGAEFVMPAGAVFDCFSDDNVYSYEIKTDKALVGFDFGSANTASCIGYEIDGVLHIEHDYHASGESASHHVHLVKSKFDKLDWAVGGSNSEDDYRKEYKDAGLLIRRPKINGRDSYSIGIETVYRLLKTKKLKIHSRCKRLLGEIRGMAYKTDGDDRILDAIEDKNSYHCFDALRYLCLMWSDPPVKAKKLGGRF